MTTDDQKLIISNRSGVFLVDGVRLEVNIVRLNGEEEWTLEVVNEQGTSTVWDDPFENDAEAWAAFEEAVDQEGVGIFFPEAEAEPSIH